MSAFLHWFAGFTAGEGCFVIHKSSGKTKTGLVYCRPRFQIKLRADDSEILSQIKQELGFGFFSKIEKHGTSKPCRMYIVHKKADMLKLIPIFDQHPLRNKKQKDYDIWREAVLYYTSAKRGNSHTGSLIDWNKMAVYKTELQAARIYS